MSIVLHQEFFPTENVPVLSLQDSPSVKSTYTASVAVPEDLKALMSANLESEHGETHADQPGYKTFKFRQDVPIPSYLLAIAVGHLESRTLGPRSKAGSVCYFIHVCMHQ